MGLVSPDSMVGRLGHEGGNLSGVGKVLKRRREGAEVQIGVPEVSRCVNQPRMALALRQRSLSSATSFLCASTSMESRSSMFCATSSCFNSSSFSSATPETRD
jgi:hypothetical protein